MGDGRWGPRRSACISRVDLSGWLDGEMASCTASVLGSDGQTGHKTTRARGRQGHELRSGPLFSEKSSQCSQGPQGQRVHGAYCKCRQR